MSSDKTFEWNGNVYDLDPTELDMGEYEAIAQRGGPDGLYEMLDGMKAMKPTPWKSLFWAQDRRRGSDVAFADYRGPTFRLILDAQNQLFADGALEAALGKDETPSVGDGSEPSPTPSDTPPPSSTS